MNERAEREALEAAPRIHNTLGRDNHGVLNMAGRDVHHSHVVHNRFHADEPLDELFGGTGPGRALMAVGLVIALAGFAAFAGLIVSGFGLVSSGGTGPTPFDHQLLGVPALAVAFGAFFAGGVLAQLGSSLSRAARGRTGGHR